jgi:hypothetical protein
MEKMLELRLITTRLVRHDQIETASVHRSAKC